MRGFGQSAVMAWGTGWGAFVVAGVVWGLVRYLQIGLVDLGVGLDIHLYYEYAKAWGAGGAPYVSFHPEYPAGALPVFLAPYLMVGANEYSYAFAGEMALFDLASLLFVIAWARRLFADSVGAAPLAGLAYLVFSAALFPVLYTRFDLVPGALVFAALFASYTPGWSMAGAILLGIAGGVKLWPFALTPLFLLLAYRRGAVGQLLLSMLGVALGTLLAVGPVLPRAGLQMLEFLEYHAARGIQIESTWSTLALALNALHLAAATPVHEYGAVHVQGPAAALFTRLSIPGVLGLALLPQLLALRSPLGRRGEDDGRVGLCVAAGSVIGFMVGGKVLSPQYMLWLAPMLAILPMLGSSVAQRTMLGLVALGCCVLTTLIYPYWSPALEMAVAGHGKAVLALGARNLCLLGLYVFAAYRAGQRGVTGESTSARGERAVDAPPRSDAESAYATSASS